MKPLWRIVLIVVLVLLSGCENEKQRMIREAQANTPGMSAPAGR